ncbi:hypothetical protein JXJ21_07495 [candidate division KSB1 bacterium]|nr:hypothetical protein [candidate division KSB1 bacterium]
MKANLFEQRTKAWATEGELAAFNLACVAEALDTVKALSDKNIGWEEVESRLGEFKSWDLDILRVDKDTENGYRRRLENLGSPITFLSEEAGHLDLNTEKTGKLLYAVCDPFDGSYLFKHGLLDFWYSAFALYNEYLQPLCCAVGDCVARKIAYAHEHGAFLAELAGDKLVRKVKLDKAYRKAMGRPDVLKMEGASIESYALKPKKFLMPLVDEYRDLLLPFKLFLPNGGPYGFVDVAEGKMDCYFARQQPYVDVFSGIYIAEQAQLIVTDFDGNPVKPSNDVKTLWDVLVTTNEVLHDQVLNAIANCRQKLHSGTKI